MARKVTYKGYQGRTSHIYVCDSVTDYMNQLRNADYNGFHSTWAGGKGDKASCDQYMHKGDNALAKEALAMLHSFDNLVLPETVRH